MVFRVWGEEEEENQGRVAPWQSRAECASRRRVTSCAAWCWQSVRTESCPLRPAAGRSPVTLTEAALLWAEGESPSGVGLRENWVTPGFAFPRGCPLSGNGIRFHTPQQPESSSYKTRAQRLRALEAANKKVEPLNLGIILKLSSRLDMLESQLLLQEIKWTYFVGGWGSGAGGILVLCLRLQQKKKKKSPFYIFPGTMSPQPPLTAKWSVLKSLDSEKKFFFSLMKISSSWLKSSFIGVAPSFCLVWLVWTWG